jgi:hypothetical protein
MTTGKTDKENIHIDRCVVGCFTGCIEHCYPGERWERVGEALTNCYGEPDQNFVAQSLAAGASVVAYGGDGMWFALCLLAERSRQ